MAVTSRVILGVSWPDEPKLRVRDGDAAESTLGPLDGFDLSYRVAENPRRRCLGRIPFRDRFAGYVDCHNEPLPGGRKCDRCTAHDATHASHLHHAHTKEIGTVDPAVDRRLRESNVAYVAAFRDGSLKIGTSNAARTPIRLAEQGAWMARVVVDAADGYVVRELEDRVTAELDLPQAVTSRRKLDGLVTPVDDAVLEARLDAAVASITGLVESLGDSGLVAVDRPWRFGFRPEVFAEPLHRYPNRLASGTHELEVVGAIGRLVAVRPVGAHDLFVADLGGLFGIVFEPGRFGSPELVVQDSLF